MCPPPAQVLKRAWNRTNKRRLIEVGAPVHRLLNGHELSELVRRRSGD